MASKLFLTARDVLKEADDPLKYINYQNIRQNNLGFLRDDVWDFHFLSMAPAVYFPGNDLLRARLQSVSPTFNKGLGELTAVVRGFEIAQPIATGTTKGTLTLTMHDLEDQALNAWLWDWSEKVQDYQNKYGFPKRDLMAQGLLTHYNVSRKEQRQYQIWNIFVTDIGQNLTNQEYNSDDASDAGNISATFSFEHYEMDFKNI